VRSVARSAVDRDEFRQRADRSVLILFATVTESLGWATAALLDQDVDVANRVISGDRGVDERCDRLSGLVKERLASGRANREELKDLIAILQMVPDLERGADLAEHIARRARIGLGGSISPRCRGLIQSMCDAGISMWQLATRAYTERSVALGREANDADEELDSLSASMLHECAADGVEPAVAAELALVARFYERIGDHAVNLARQAGSMSKLGGAIATGHPVVPH
jgi:phosphate transport system protein